MSGLTIDVLAKIWNLIDTAGTGKMSQNQFVIAMALIQKLRQGILPSVPPSIPQALVNFVMAANELKSPVGSRPDSSFQPRQSISSVNPLSSVPEVPKEVPWVVPETDIKQFYAYFEKLDKQKTGFITGDQGYSFFLKSKLPEAYLAVVW